MNPTSFLKLFNYDPKQVEHAALESISEAVKRIN